MHWDDGLAVCFAVGVQGKRGDGRPSTAAASPNTAKSALEALLTYEGLEKVRLSSSVAAA